MIHVLFDIDGTLLIVPKGIDVHGSTVMFRKFFDVDAHEEMIANVGKTEFGIIKEVFEKLQGRSYDLPIPKEAYQIWAEETAKGLKDHPAHILPGIPQLLDALVGNKNVQLGLLTGNSSYRAEEKIKSVGFDTFFNDPVTGKIRGVFGELTPVRSELIDIVKQQITPEDHFVIIDDSLIGAKMVQEHAIPSILVATGGATEEELRPFSENVFPDFGDKRWEQVVRIVESL